MISPTDLFYFVEIAQTLNLTHTATQLGVSQPSLSLAMKRLEESIQTPLLIREKRGVKLTPAGIELLIHAKAWLEQWDYIRERAYAANHEIQGDVTIGCHTSIALGILDKILPNLIKKHPKLRIHLQHENSRKITEEIIDLSVDIGIVVNTLLHPDLVVRTLYNDIITFWYNPHNQVINNMEEIDTLLYDQTSLMAQKLLKQGKELGYKLTKVITSPSLEVLAQMALVDGGVCIVPACVAHAISSHLVRVPNAPFHLDEICLIYRDEKRSIKAIQTVINAIQDYFKKSNDHGV